MSLLWVAGFLLCVRWAHGTEYWNTSEVASVNNGGGGSSPLLVGLTLIQSAAAKHAGNTHVLPPLICFLVLSDLCTLYGL